MTFLNRSSGDLRLSTSTTLEPNGALVYGLVACTHLVILLLLYSQTYSFDYVYFDDAEYVLENSAVRAGLTPDGVKWAFTSFHMSNWHPLTWLSHMLDVSLFGIDPGWAHLHNIALHGINSLLVYAVLLKYSKNWWKACVLSLVFLVHPLHVESVAWIAERKDLLCAFFFLLGLLLYDSYRARPGKLLYTLVFLVYVLALMAKPMAVTFPVVLLILDFFVYPKCFQTAPASRVKIDYYQAILEKLPLFGLSAASCVVTIIAQDTGHALAYLEKHSLTARWRTATNAYLIYLRQFLFPVDLAAFYPLPESKSLANLLFPGFALLILVALAAMFASVLPLIAAGLYFYLATLIPVIGLVQVGGQAHADRYMYLPSVGLLVMCIYLIPSKGKKHFELCSVLALFFISYLMMVSYWQISYWENRHSLFSRVLDVTGPNYRAYTHLGGYYLDRGMLEEARRQSRAAVALKPESPVAYRLMGHIVLSEGKLQAAERFYYLALAKGDYSAELQNNLGIVLAEQGRIAEGIKALEKALQIEPTMPKAQLNLQLYRRRTIQKDSL